MYKRNFFGWLALVLMCAGATFVGYFYLVAPQTLRVATPPAETLSTQFLQAMASALRKEGAPVRLTVIPYETNEGIVMALESKKADLAVVRTDRPLPSSAVGVAELGRYVTLVLTRPGSGIEKFADLQGRSVIELTRSTTDDGVFRELARLNRFGRDDFKLLTVSSLSAIDAALSAGKVDAVLVSAPRGSKTLLDQLRTVEHAIGAPPNFVPVKEAAALAKIKPIFKAEDIAAGELSSAPSMPDAALPTATFPLMLVTRRQESAATIQEFAAQLFDIRSSLMAQYPGAARLAALDTTRGGAIPVHPGAAAYYDAKEKSLLDRYSDLLWLLLFGFSSIASVGVWLVRRLFPSERELLRAEHAEMLNIMREVRARGDEQMLARAEKRVDECVARVSKLALDGKLEDSEKSAFDIAIARIETIITGKRQSGEQR